MQRYLSTVGMFLGISLEALRGVARYVSFDINLLIVISLSICIYKTIQSLND